MADCGSNGPIIAHARIRQWTPSDADRPTKAEPLCNNSVDTRIAALQSRPAHLLRRGFELRHVDEDPCGRGNPSQLPRFIQVVLAGEALDERRTSMSEASPSSSAKSSAVRPFLSTASSLTLESASRKRTEGSEPISIAWCSAV